MDRATPTVAEVFRRYGDTVRARAGATLATAQRRVMTAIAQCRTAALGGHVEQCDHCGHRRVWYHSCRNRHCPQCQALARAAWIQARAEDLLACEYFHVVFTVPQEVAVIATQNKAVVDGLLFRTVADTLRTIAADPTHLGAQIGFFAVLHTWGQTLVHHPHLHCVIPGGGLSFDGTRWVACRPGFFLPVRVLSRLFRRLFLHALSDAFDTGQLRFSGPLQALSDRQAFADQLAPARQTEWVVYAKLPFAGPAQVLDYVGRYTHRVAITNHRLLDIDAGHVRFRYTDYRHGRQQTTMTLAAEEFIRRFLSTCSRPASIACATMASSAIGTAPRSWRAVGTCSGWPCRRRRQTSPRHHPTIGTSTRRSPGSPSAPVPPVTTGTCWSSTPSPGATAALHASTPHDPHGPTTQRCPHDRAGLPSQDTSAAPGFRRTRPPRRTAIRCRVVRPPPAFATRRRPWVLRPGHTRHLLRLLPTIQCP